MTEHTLSGISALKAPEKREYLKTHFVQKAGNIKVLQRVRLAEAAFKMLLVRKINVYDDGKRKKPTLFKP